MWRFFLLMLWPTFGFAIFYYSDDDKPAFHDETDKEISEHAGPWEREQLQKFLADHGLVGLPLGVFSAAMTVTCLNFYFNNYVDNWPDQSYPFIDTTCRKWLLGFSIFSVGFFGVWLFKDPLLAMQNRYAEWQKQYLDGKLKNNREDFLQTLKTKDLKKITEYLFINYPDLRGLFKKLARAQD